MTHHGFTPGPWRVDPKARTRVVRGENDTVTSTACQSDLMDDWHANARLIAAAPDMLSVLQFFACIDFDNFTEHDEALLEDVKRDARAAIRKTGAA